MKATKYWFGIAVWSVCLLLGITYLSLLKVKDFDPNGELSRQAMDISFDDKLLSYIQANAEIKKNTVIHFEKDACFCQHVAAPHIASVKKLAARNEMSNQIVIVKNGDLALIPSVPAVAVIDGQGVLRYFGPYSTGMFCTEGSGIVEKFITSRVAGVHLIGTNILADAKGCYCEV